MAGPWICVMVNATFQRGEKQALGAELVAIFGDDLSEARVVCDESMKQSGEYYAFLRCSNYHNHIERLISSMAVTSIVSDYDHPSYLSDFEVDEFVASVVRAKTKRQYWRGDLVVVKDGHFLAGLNGLVVSVEGKKCDVSFRLNTRCFVERLSVTELEYIDNVFLHIRSPMTLEALRLPVSRELEPEAREAVLASRHKVHRQSH